MAYDFLGTIESIEDFEAFEEFVQVEIKKVSSRIRYLTSEIDRFEILLDKYKVADLTLRADYKKSDQADANWLVSPRSREQLKLTQLDGRNALDVDDLKKIFFDTIKIKRERNEFKIKRIHDLIQQFEKEREYLTARKEDYQDKLDLIRVRFDMPDFPEVQRTKPLDSADVEEGIRAVPKDAGKEISGSTVTYVVINIDGARKSITFDYTAPPVKKGDYLLLSGGSNDGYVTVQEYRDSRTIIVYDDVTTENPSKTRVTLV